tara:strand:- start:7343 stop:7642 length:300 start_codon:yes stop_codon:yes gene_type:complete
MVMDDHRDLARDYLAGATMIELAGKYGVNHTTIHRRLKAAGVPTRSCGARTTEQKLEFAARVAEPPQPIASPYVDTSMLSEIPLKPAIQARVLGGRVWR